ncbi:MAG: EAL domain-containing protein [Chromatiaceae bacterium]|nr:EAL domain-containing protein [Chromatiaceae bacterium]MBP8288628.1 EAL domain-containing protein [Chromatiaceae bacterium]
MRLLHVEDDPTDIDLTRRLLARRAPDIAIAAVPSLAAARDCLVAPDHYEVALVDLKLPDGSGLELLTWIRDRQLPLAVVMLTGAGDPEAAITALQAGADDYLTKDLATLEQLPATLRAAWEHFNDAQARRARPLRVLYAEHHPADFDLTQRHLARYAPHIHLTAVADVPGILARLPADPGAPADFDLVLLDYVLPGLDALEALKVLRAERGLDIPLVIVSGQGSEAIAARAMHLGASDYLVKNPGYLHKLPATLEKAWAQVELARERAQLRATTDRLAQVLATSPVILYTRRLDAPARPLTWVSDNLARLLGYQVAAALAPDWWPAHLHPQDREPALAWLDQLGAGGARCLTYRFRDGQGRMRWIEDAIGLPDGEAGAGAGIQATGAWRDVTEAKQIDNQLRQAATLFESTREGVLITDLKARVLNVNQAFTDITGYSGAEILGLNPRLLSSGRQDRAFYQDMWASITVTGHWQGEVWNRRKNGEIYPLILSISVVRDPEGRPSHYVGVMTDISQLKESEARLEDLVHYDSLTRLPNRRLLQSRLEHALEHAERQGRGLAVLFIDLDRFKHVNDSLGHPVGDALLVAMAQRLSQRLRTEDTLGRLGGDEFLLLMEQPIRPEDAAGLAQTLLGLLEQPFILPGEPEIYMGASIGISLYPEDGRTATDLIRHAETALYQAKAEGGGTYRFHAPSLTRTTRDRLGLEGRLHRALAKGEFQLHYQPQFEIPGGRLIGCEALLRWPSPTDGLITPDTFIPLAEETGLILPLGEWALRTACAQGQAWRAAGLPTLAIGVNLSARQLRQPDLVERVAAILAQTGLPPEWLKFELTESMIMGQGEQAPTLLRALKALGLGLSIDDFGTGYSSLARLKNLPIDELKIDRDFVRDIPEDRNDMEIAATIIAMARNLNLKVIAEGVETQAQLDFLARQGCHGCQGFLLGRPVPAEIFQQRFLQPPILT